MSDERPTSDAAEDGPDGGGPPWSSEAGNSGERVSDADADAWAKACAEDLAEEKARRRAQHGPPPGSAAEELRRLVDTVSDRLSGLQSPLFGAVAVGGAQQMVNKVVQQARAVVEPDVFDHLAAAGSELLAAYRSAVEAQERRWTRDGAPHKPDEQSGPGEHIDLD